VILSYGQKRAIDGRQVLLRHIERTGCTIAGDPVWTEVEIAGLRYTYPDRSAACAALPRRTPEAIAKKAQQLRLVTPRRVWTEDEIVRLRRPYVGGVSIAELVNMFPGKSRSQIWKKAQHLRYRRPRRPPNPTGMPLVDRIRQRAFECRLSMTDLDAFVGRKRYFVSPRYVNWRALQKAMEALGGRPVVYWPHG
jgi:hypothetical protein